MTIKLSYRVSLRALLRLTPLSPTHPLRTWKFPDLRKNYMTLVLSLSLELVYTQPSTTTLRYRELALILGETWKPSRANEKTKNTMENIFYITWMLSSKLSADHRGIAWCYFYLIWGFFMWILNEKMPNTPFWA